MSNYYTYSYITLQELKAQIATGALQTPAEIAAIIKISSDPAVVCWAFKHTSYQIRSVAIRHINCPFGNIVKALFFDPSKRVQDAARKVIDEERREELEQFLVVLEDYPQLSFPFVKTIDKNRQLCRGIDDEADDEDDEVPF